MPCPIMAFLFEKHRPCAIIFPMKKLFSALLFSLPVCGLAVQVLFQAPGLAAKPKKTTLDKPLEVITVQHPPAKYTASSDLVLLQGRIKPSNRSVLLTVNGRKVPQKENGRFEAALILRSGKNLARISALEASGKKQIVESRMLRTIKYPDMEELYLGRLHWARKVVSEMATAGIVEAFPDGSFMPDELVTRGEFATWLCRAKGLPLGQFSYTLLPDVPPEHWRSPYIYAVLGKGYMDPLPGGLFGIDEPLSRSDAGYYLTKAVGIQPVLEKSQSDTIEAYLDQVKKENLQAAIEEGYIIGISQRAKVYDIDRNMTRAEAANMISRIKEARNKISLVHDWSKGFDEKVLCEVNIAPAVTAKASPDAVYADGVTKVGLYAKVVSEVGTPEVVVVKADMRQLGGPADAVMYDDESHGDAAAGDGIFSLTFPVGTEIPAGAKIIQVAAVNKWGLSSSDTARLRVFALNRPPIILSSISYPFAVRPGGAAVLAVRVEDQDGASDIESVSADLSALGGTSKEILVDNGTSGDVKSGDLIFMKEIRVPSGIKSSSVPIPVVVRDKKGGASEGQIKLDIL